MRAACSPGPGLLSALWLGLPPDTAPQPLASSSHVKQAEVQSFYNLCKQLSSCSCSCVGRQVKYVVELARALAQHPAVYRVDLLTRLIQDPNVDSTYGESEERIWQAPDEKGLGGAYIERLACGPPKTYLRCPCLLPQLFQLPCQGSIGGTGKPICLAHLQSAWAIYRAT